MKQKFRLRDSSTNVFLVDGTKLDAEFQTEMTEELQSLVDKRIVIKVKEVSTTKKINKEKKEDGKLPKSN